MHNQTSTMFYKNIGAWVKKERLFNNKTQTDIGKVLNVTFQQIQKYENANNHLNLEFFVRLCEYFKQDISTVVSNCRDNLYLPEELVKQGYITVSSEEIAKDPNVNLSAKYWIGKESE